MRGRGFSLIEVIVALGLFAMLLISLLIVIPAAASATREAGYRNTASSLAREEVDRLAAGSVSLGAQPVISKEVNGVSFTLHPTVEQATPDVPIQMANNSHASPSNFSNINPDHARLVSVVVRWRESDGEPRAHTVKRQVFVHP